MISAPRQTKVHESINDEDVNYCKLNDIQWMFKEINQ